MNKVYKWAFRLVMVVLILIQFVPVDRSNPPVTGEVAAPNPVMEVLQNSCYDCHSNETRWPWYSRVAPVSWRISEHVQRGRGALNFSEWQSLSPEDQGEAREEIWEKVERGVMPLSDYLRMHPEAVLTDSQKDALRRWAEGQAQALPDWN